MSSHLSLRTPYLVLGCIALIGWAFFFLRSEYFDVHDVEIQASGGAVTSMDVLPTVFSILDGQSARPWSKRQRYFLPERKLEQGIQEALYAEQVEVGKTSNNILRLKIVFGSRFLYITQNGEEFLTCTVARPAGVQLTDTAVLTAAKKRFLATDFTTHKLDGIVYVRKATTTLDVPSMKRLLELGKSLEDHRLAYAHIRELDAQQVSVQIDRSAEALLDLAQPLEGQVERIQSILRDKDYIARRPLQIDVRIPGRAYIR